MQLLAAPAPLVGTIFQLQSQPGWVECFPPCVSLTLLPLRPPLTRTGDEIEPTHLIQGTLLSRSADQHLNHTCVCNSLLPRKAAHPGSMTGLGPWGWPTGRRACLALALCACALLVAQSLCSQERSVIPVSLLLSPRSASSAAAGRILAESGGICSLRSAALLRKALSMER